MPYVLGVDLGTTFTAAAVCEPGAEPRMLSLGSNSYAVPSVVFLRDDGSFLTGEAAELQSESDATRVARHFKRRLGDDTPVLLSDTAFRPEELVGRLLTWVVEESSSRRGEAPSRLVLTHPANWGSYRTDLLAVAASTLGVGEVVLLSEPEAAAIHYVQTERIEPGEIIGVYDLGGGTFDAVMMRRTNDGFEAVGRPIGVERLGGVDFDDAIRSFVMEAADLHDLDTSHEDVVAAAHALQSGCVAAKRVLSADTVAHVRVAFPGVSKAVRMNRAEFEHRIRPRLLETLTAFESAMTSAGLVADDLSRILLVGGSSRIPLVSALLSQRFGRPLAVDTDPKNTVALGAALLGTEVPLSVGPRAAAPEPVAPSQAPEPNVAPVMEPPPVEQVDPRMTMRLPEPLLPSTEPATTMRPEPVPRDEPHRQTAGDSPTGLEPAEVPADSNDLLGVKAESGHRARIPQPAATTAPEPVAPVAEAEAVGMDSKMLTMVAIILVVVLLVVGVVVFFTN